MNPPVYLDGEGALLDDGTFVPEAAIQTAVDVITAACRYIESLPPETRAALDVEALFAGLDEEEA